MQIFHHSVLQPILASFLLTSQLALSKRMSWRHEPSIHSSPSQSQDLGHNFLKVFMMMRRVQWTKALKRHSCPLVAFQRMMLSYVFRCCLAKFLKSTNAESRLWPCRNILHLYFEPIFLTASLTDPRADLDVPSFVLRIHSKEGAATGAHIYLPGQLPSLVQRKPKFRSAWSFVSGAPTIRHIFTKTTIKTLNSIEVHKTG